MTRPPSSTASPTPSPVMLRTNSEPLTAPDVLHHALVLDLPERGAYLDVLHLPANLLVQLFGCTFVLAQGDAQLAAKLVVFDVDFLDVAGVEQDLDQLFEDVVHRFLADLDLLLLRQRAQDPAVVFGWQSARCERLASLGHELAFRLRVLAQHRLEIELDLTRNVGLDVAGFEEQAKHLLGNVRNLVVRQKHIDCLAELWPSRVRKSAKGAGIR